MPRLQALLLLPLLAVLAPMPARALDIEEILCTCADDATDVDDFVSCVSKLSRRLVATGVISRTARAQLIAAATRIDVVALELECEDTPKDCFEGWGVGLHVESPFYPEADDPEEAGTVVGLLRQWNFSEEDAYQVNTRGTSCPRFVRILDRFDRVVREERLSCGATIIRRDLPVGSLFEEPVKVPLLALNADPRLGLVDGQPLPPGIYRVEARWSASGPQVGPGIVTEGGSPLGIIAIRIGKE